MPIYKKTVTSGGSGTPADTVADETTYGVAKTAGASTDYSRGDHTHGTMVTPTKTTVGLGNVVNADTTTTANITDSSNKRFITDAQQIVLGNTSGTNTGDQTTATTQSPADNSTKFATTAYVDNAVLGQDFKEAAKYATTAALPAIIYSNGSSGVGGTLTGAAFGALGIDSASPSVNDRILVKNQVATAQNGIYKVTATGSGIAVFVLTRTTDFDQNTDIMTGDSLFVSSGTVNATTTWAFNGADNPVLGTDAISFAQTAGQGSFSAGNGIAITGTSIAVDTSITVDKTTAQVLTNKDLSSGTNTFPTFNQNTTGTAAIPDIATSKLTPSTSETVAANLSAVVNRSYKIASGTKLTLGLGSRFRIL